MISESESKVPVIAVSFGMWKTGLESCWWNENVKECAIRQWLTKKTCDIEEKADVAVQRSR